jgi:hypothetical protein
MSGSAVGTQKSSAEEKRALLSLILESQSLSD